MDDSLKQQDNTVHAKRKFGCFLGFNRLLKKENRWEIFPKRPRFAVKSRLATTNNQWFARVDIVKIVFLPPKVEKIFEFQQPVKHTPVGAAKRIPAGMTNTFENLTK